MSKKRKLVGATVVAALAVSAVAAISASGSGSGHFTAASAPISVHIVQEGQNWFFTDSPQPALQCDIVTFSGSAANTTETSLTVTPKFEGCSSSLGDIHVNTNGCTFQLTIETHTNTTENNVHLICGGATKHITLAATSFIGTCHIKIPPQTTAGGVRYTQVDADTITVDVNATGITSTKHPSDFFGLACSGAATHGSGGMLEGQALASSAGGVAISTTGSTGS